MVDLDKLLKKARIAMIMDQPFFATVILSLPMVKNNSLPAPMGTDGISLFYNEDILQFMIENEGEEKAKEKIKTIFAHEALHITNMHHLRQKGRKALAQSKICKFEPGSIECGKKCSCNRESDNCKTGNFAPNIYSLWNIATDFSINYQLKEAGFLTEGLLNDEELGKNSGEKNYLILLKKMEKNKNNSGDIPVPSMTGRGDIMSPKDITGKELSEASVRMMEERIKDIVKNAAEAAKKAGKLPSSIERYVKTLLEPQINWKEAISHFVSRFAKNDYDWTKRSRRYTKFYLPSLRSPEVGKLKIAIDTSGSLQEKDLTEIASEVMGIISTYGTIEADVIYCDSRVNKTEHYDSFDIIKLSMVGGGGTDYIPVFNKIDKDEDEPVALLYFTDGYCNSFPKKSPDYPVMWVLTYKNEEFKPPFGETIFIHKGREFEDE